MAPRAKRANASALPDRAECSSNARADLEAADLLATANGIALTAADDGQTRRLLNLLRHGVTAPP